MLTLYFSFCLFVVVLIVVAAATYVVVNDVFSIFYTWRNEKEMKRMTRMDYTGWTGREP